MQHSPIASPTRSTALAACIAALALAFAGPATAKPETILTERAGDQALPALPQVVDPPSDRVAGSAPTASQTSSTSTASDDGDNAPLIVGLSLATVALLGSGTYVARRRRHVAPGH